jgi:hypothetical protein
MNDVILVSLVTPFALAEGSGARAYNAGIFNYAPTNTIIDLTPWPTTASSSCMT